MAGRYQGKTCLGGEIIVRGTRINLEQEDWWHTRGRGRAICNENRIRETGAVNGSP